MADYRCYVLNKEDRVSSRHDIQADSDADAMIQAGLIGPFSDEFPNVEVWLGDRRVGRVPHAHTATSDFTSPLPAEAASVARPE